MSEFHYTLGVMAGMVKLLVIQNCILSLYTVHTMHRSNRSKLFDLNIALHSYMIHIYDLCHQVCRQI